MFYNPNEIEETKKNQNIDLFTDILEEKNKVHQTTSMKDLLEQTKFNIREWAPKEKRHSILAN